MENLNGTERVMVISPHPDDVNFGCSGTIAGWSRLGSGHYLCYLYERG